MNRDLTNIIALATGVLLLAVGGPWLLHEVRTLPHARALAARADQRVVTLEVNGMTCSACAKAVESHIALVPGGQLLLPGLQRLEQTRRLAIKRGGAA
jgi:hypothetical protein